MNDTPHRDEDNQARHRRRHRDRSPPTNLSLMRRKPIHWQHSKIFNAADADIVILSSDDVQFRLHRKRLELNSGVFPPAELAETSSNEVVRLTESGETLELFFQSMYPQKFPSLSGLKVDLLFELAEAAEKYEVFPLISICEFYLRLNASKCPRRVLDFAAKHDHDALIRKVAPLLVDEMPLSDLAGVLPPRLYKPWSLYRERWVQEATITVAHVRPHDCRGGSRYALYQSLLLAPFIHDYSKFWADLIKEYRMNCCLAEIVMVKKLLASVVERITPLQLPEPAAATEN
ncbi:hypothetical protein F5878DRAFT_639687 [Lentinula raphanica]|uniref:BTB domain-containing protein n=1 Tax=Lentinula raphanica TaxID=153919 RepID=A0AA38PEB2_9AGAR|nr:hypothetical protein F5878DRAFT_639687 [Lentinula raphanica]